MQLTPLAKVMKRAKWTSVDVETICGVTRQSVWNWTHGKHVPKAEDIGRMLEALKKKGVSAEFGDFLPKIRRAA